jgi:uncharacterized protein YndB with AHSA1/START domain
MAFKIDMAIDAPPDQVWRALTEVEAWPAWTASMTSVERLETGEFGLGSSARVTQPKLKPTVYQVTEFVPGRAFTWAAKAGGVTTTAGHTVTPRGEGLSTVTLTVTQSGPLAPLVGMLAANTVRRYVTMEAEGLKKRCEGGPDDS